MKLVLKNEMNRFFIPVGGELYFVVVPGNDNNYKQ